MKITKAHLKKIIKEELEGAMVDAPATNDWADGGRMSIQDLIDKEGVDPKAVVGQTFYLSGEGTPIKITAHAPGPNDDLGHPPDEQDSYPIEGSTHHYEGTQARVEGDTRKTPYKRYLEAVYLYTKPSKHRYRQFTSRPNRDS